MSGGNDKYNSVGCDNSITVRHDNNCQVTGGGWWEGARRHCYDINYRDNVCEISVIETQQAGLARLTVTEPPLL